VRLIDLLRRLERAVREHGDVDVDAPTNVRIVVNAPGALDARSHAEQSVRVVQRRKGGA
jgi:hypothetical protein